VLSVTKKGEGCKSGAGLKDPVPMSAPLSVVLLPRELVEPIEKRRAM